VDGDRIMVGDAEMRMRIVAPVAPTEATVRLTLPPLSQVAAAGAPPPMPPMAPVAEAERPTAPPPLSAPPPPKAPLPADDLDPWDKTPPAPLELPLEPLPAPRPVAPPPMAAPPPPRPAPPPLAAPPMAPIAPPPMAAPPLPPAAAPPRPVAPPPLPPPPRAAAPPPMAPPTMAPPPAPPRPIDPPLQMELPPRSAAAVASPPPAPPAPPARKEALGSVTAIDRIPIPVPAPAVVQASKLERAQPAGFWIRVAAMVVDCIPAWILAGISIGLTFFVSGALGSLVNVLSFAYGIYVFLVLPALKAQTIGMKLLGLRIVHASVPAGQGLGWNVAVVRFVGHIVCGFTLGVGYLLVAFTSQKQGLHDLIASTRVVRVR
jgi:uncharacterized RDD family membrane protein YckC